jgi:CBS domain-containing protein
MVIEGQNLVGVITRKDILRAVRARLTRADEVIQQPRRPQGLGARARPDGQSR